MNQQYLELFKGVTHAAELLAEQVSQYNLEQGTKKQADLALTMRDDYRSLKEKFEDENFNGESLTRADYAKLLVCAWVVSQNLEERIKQIEKALQGYKIDLLPKLNRILEETENTFQANKLAKELFDF